MDIWGSDVQSSDISGSILDIGGSIFLSSFFGVHFWTFGNQNFNMSVKLKIFPQCCKSAGDSVVRLLAAECCSANNQFHVNHKPLPIPISVSVSIASHCSCDTTGFYMAKLDEIGYRVCSSGFSDVYETIQNPEFQNPAIGGF